MSFTLPAYAQNCCLYHSRPPVRSESSLFEKRGDDLSNDKLRPISFDVAEDCSSLLFHSRIACFRALVGRESMNVLWTVCDRLRCKDSQKYVCGYGNAARRLGFTPASGHIRRRPRISAERHLPNVEKLARLRSTIGSFWHDGIASDPLNAVFLQCTQKWAPYLAFSTEVI